MQLCVQVPNGIDHTNNMNKMVHTEEILRVTPLSS